MVIIKNLSLVRINNIYPTFFVSTEHPNPATTTTTTTTTTKTTTTTTTTKSAEPCDEADAYKMVRGSGWVSGSIRDVHYFQGLGLKPFFFLEITNLIILTTCNFCCFLYRAARFERLKILNNFWG